MMKDRRKYTGLFLILLLLLVSSCEKSGLDFGGTGTLMGTISIGPLCPVESNPPDPACQPTAGTYKSYPVSVWSMDMKTKIAVLAPALDGSYHAILPSGNWLVVLEKQAVGFGGSNLPVSIKINDGSDTVLDISIDTGIR